MRNTTFNMNVNGTEYKVYNGTAGDCVIVEAVATGLKVIVKEEGTYANKTCVRRAILKTLDAFEAQNKEFTEDEMVTYAEYAAEMEHEAEIAMEMEQEETADIDRGLLDFYNRNWRKYTDTYNPVEFEKKVQDGEISIDEEMEEHKEQEKEELKDFVDQIAEATEPTKVINDVIFRNLPKYVQKAIDYCDYVNGVYRIHVNTEFGSKEIAADKWADASASVKNYCKTGTEE